MVSTNEPRRRTETEKQAAREISKAMRTLATLEEQARDLAGRRHESPAYRALFRFCRRVMREEHRLIDDLLTLIPPVMA